jgi:hypothetical protein
MKFGALGLTLVLALTCVLPPGAWAKSNGHGGHGKARGHHHGTSSHHGFFFSGYPCGVKEGRECNQGTSVEPSGRQAAPSIIVTPALRSSHPPLCHL